MKGSSVSELLAASCRRLIAELGAQVTTEATGGLPGFLHQSTTPIDKDLPWQRSSQPASQGAVHMPRCPSEVTRSN